jgi:hypothetical protein
MAVDAASWYDLSPKKGCFVSPSQPESDRVNIGVLVVGAGRVGLYAVYCAGFRGLSVAHWRGASGTPRL